MITAALLMVRVLFAGLCLALLGCDVTGRAEAGEAWITWQHSVSLTRENWSVVGAHSSEAECRDVNRRFLEYERGEAASSSSPRRRVTNASVEYVLPNGDIQTLTPVCLPAGVDPRPR
jgi:hypothetical protein